MKITFVVFWLSQERKIYGDDSYYVLGEYMTSCNTEEAAVKYIKSLNLGFNQLCTILKVYSGDK